MTARSYLYVPGNRPEKLAKAALRGADALILDLEDAVPPEEKDGARRAVVEWLCGPAVPGGPEIWVRVNSGPLLADDVRPLVRIERLAGVYLPKVASRDDVMALGIRLHDSALGIVPLIETAAAVLDAAAIASAPRIAHVALGEADLGAELGIDASPDGREWSSIRTQVVLASAAAGIDPPVGPVSTDFADLDALRASTHALRRMGFGGRAAIHPAQVAIINEVFTPSEDEVRAAKELIAALEAAGGATTGPDGRMIDEPVIKAARLVLARARS